MTEQVAGGAGHPSSKADTPLRAVKVATRPYSGPAALIGWFCVAAGLPAVAWVFSKKAALRASELRLWP